ncbi:hypothetical protein WN943_011517 [Citrus x changshan-huyou]
MEFPVERWKALRSQRKASGRDDRELGFSFGWGTMNTRNITLARWIKLGLYRAFLAQILAPLLQSTQTEQIDCLSSSSHRGLNYSLDVVTLVLFTGRWRTLMAGDGDKTLVLWVEHALSNEKLRGCWCGGDLAVRWLLGRLKAWRDDQSTSAVS